MCMYIVKLHFSYSFLEEAREALVCKCVNRIVKQLRFDEVIVIYAIFCLSVCWLVGFCFVFVLVLLLFCLSQYCCSDREEICDC